MNHIYWTDSQCHSSPDVILVVITVAMSRLAMRMPEAMAAIHIHI